MTRTLSLLGAALPKNLMKTQSDNPSGFWESESIQILNDEILQALDSEWDDVFAFRPRQYLSNFDRFYLGRAGELLEQEFGGSHLIVIKDPRVSVIAAFWDRVLREAGYATSYVVMVRNPLEVAASLRDRNAFPREKSLLLWTSYMLALERDTREQERVFVSYDELIGDWRAVRRRIEESMAVPFPRDTAAAANDIDRFLNRSFRHHDANGDALLSSPDIPDHVKTLYRVFMEACGGGGIDRVALDSVHAKLSDIDATVGPVVADLRARTRALASEVGAVSNQLQIERDQRHSEAGEAARAADDLRRQLDEVTGRVQAVEVEREQALALSRSKDDEIADLRRQLEEVASHVQAVEMEREQALALSRTKNDEIDEIAKLKDGQIAELRRQLEEIASHVQAVEMEREQALALSRTKNDEIAELAKRKDGQIADLAARIADADSKLAAADSTLKTVNEDFTGNLRKVEAERDAAQSVTRSAEQKLAERSKELAAITQLLHEQERHTERMRENLFWAAAVQQHIAHHPRWWSLMRDSSRRRHILRLLKQAGLFDSDAYLQLYPDVAAAGFDPLDHYLQYGMYEGRVRNG
jgi:hypothetical protein